MRPDRPPATASWRHNGLRSGFEAAYFTNEVNGLLIEGTTVGLQDGATWVVSYEVHVDLAWRTRVARITIRTSSGSIDRHLEADAVGHWLIDGEEADHLTGCLDVDLESSAMTNALPVHRLALARGERASAPAAYVRLPDASIERLEQRYTRIEGQPDGRDCYEYHAPVFDFRCVLVYDEAGLVLDYPGIAVRTS